MPPATPLHGTRSAELSLRLRECLKQPRYYRRIWEEVLRYPLLERIAALAGRITIGRRDTDTFAPFAESAAARIGTGGVLELPPDAAGQAKAFLGALRRAGEAY